MATNKLTARTVQTTKKPGIYSDGGGLYLRVRDSTSRSWVFIYKLDKRRREMGLGSASDVTLAEARQKRQTLRELLAKKIDPLELNQQDRAVEPVAPTFGVVATDLINTLKPGWKNKKHAQQWMNTLTQHAAHIWDMPVDAIDTEAMLAVLTPIWQEIPETASRVRARIERVLHAAKARGFRSGENPARWKENLEFVLPKRAIAARKHHPAMPYTSMPDFVKELRGRPALAARALEFLILTAARTSEVIKAEWDEFDLEKKIWIVPAHRMKAGSEHRVPLTERAVEIIEHVRFHNKERPFEISNMAMEMLLRRMDFDDYTVHGFRSSFRDWVGEETDFPREVAEAALAHQVGNDVERAYRRGDALEKRRKLMESWEAYVGSAA